MTLPTSIMVECPSCKEDTLHEVLAGKMSGRKVPVLDTTVRCRECGHTHQAVLRGEKPVELPVIISWQEKSERVIVSLGPEEGVQVGDEIMCGELPVLVTSIESDGRRLKKARAKDIDSIWAKRFDKVKVPFSINHQGKTSSESLIVLPDEEFYIGEVMLVGKRDVVIHSIKTASKSLRTGGAVAREIVRVYANVIRKTSH
jgi:uncharacterized Zn finger protein